MPEHKFRPRAFIDRRIQPGDIILTTTPEPMSKLIRHAIGADISHAMICVSSSSVIDSTGEGVHSRNLRRIVLEPGCAGHVLRPVRPLSLEQLQAVIEYARGMIGTRYSKADAAKSVLAGFAPGRRQFCSRLVGQAYRHAGVQLVKNPDFCHPGELLKSPLLEEVPDVLMELSPKQAAYRREDKDNVQDMRGGTNTLLQMARQVSPGIETLNDIDDYLKDHPEADGRIVEALHKSGYLELWRPLFEQTPWQYDIELLEALNRPMPEIQDYCADLVMDEQLGQNRFVMLRAAYMGYHMVYPLEYFQLQTDLYTILAKHHAQRLRTAVTWLERRGLLTRVSTTHLRPHTLEWYLSLMEWDPRLALKVSQAVQAAGENIAICTYCSKEPTRDYVAVNPPPAGPGTFRLCDACLSSISDEDPMTSLS